MTSRSAICACALALVAGGAVATASGRPVMPMQGPGVSVNIVSHDKLTAMPKPTVLIDTGVVSGSPVGGGTIELTYLLQPRKSMAKTTFTIRNGKGSVRGACASTYTTSAAQILMTGACRIVRGTGAYTGITSTPLQFNADHNLITLKVLVTMQGRASYSK